MAGKLLYCIVLQFLLVTSGCSSCSFENVTALYRFLLDDDRNVRMIRPIFNQTKPVTVDLSLFLHSLVNFDDIHGLLYIIASFGMFWVDELKVWDEMHFGISKISFKGSDVWTPDVRLVNQGGELLNVRCTSPEDEVTYDNKGNAYCFLAHQFIISCSPNMFRFPFDEHSCSLQFLAKATQLEVMFNSAELDAEINFDDTFLQWKMTPLNSEISTTGKVSISKVTYYVLLQRNPYFILINVIFPNCVLGCVHLLVFFLPIESGERIGYSITIYLALVVFMSNISSMVPQTSNPISVFNVMLFSQLFISSCIMASVIFISRLYHADRRENVSTLLRKMFLRKKNGKVHEVETSNLNPWNDIGKALDKMMFYIFLFCMCTEVLIMFLLLKYG